MEYAHQKKEIKFKQCEMVKEWSPGVKKKLISWIPEKFAVLGKFLRLRDNDNGWEVVGVFEPALDESVVNESSRYHLKHRDATDI